MSSPLRSNYVTVVGIVIVHGVLDVHLGDDATVGVDLVPVVVHGVGVLAVLLIDVVMNVVVGLEIRAIVDDPVIVERPMFCVVLANVLVPNMIVTGVIGSMLVVVLVRVKLTAYTFVVIMSDSVSMDIDVLIVVGFSANVGSVKIVNLVVVQNLNPIDPILPS